MPSDRGPVHRSWDQVIVPLRDSSDRFWHGSWSRSRFMTTLSTEATLDFASDPVFDRQERLFPGQVGPIARSIAIGRSPDR